MRKKIPAVLTAMLVVLGFSVATAAPSFASTPTTQIRCTTYQTISIAPGDWVYVPARPVSGSPNLADCTLWKNQALAPNVATNELQLGLIRCSGQASVVGTVDGVFGPATQTGVMNVQRSARLAVDGVYGNDTKGAMGFYTESGGCGWIAANVFR